jgi:hypothetical protein
MNIRKAPACFVTTFKKRLSRAPALTPWLHLPLLVTADTDGVSTSLAEQFVLLFIRLCFLLSPTHAVPPFRPTASYSRQVSSQSAPNLFHKREKNFDYQSRTPLQLARKSCGFLLPKTLPLVKLTILPVSHAKRGGSQAALGL